MAIPSNGITAEVIRDIMPPYHLSDDLLEGTFAALPPPPADASAAWRRRRITRLTAEITALRPADAGQARMAAGVLILRELADSVTRGAYAPGTTIAQMCRISRSAGELARTANALGRALERSQQKPVPFYGTVIEDAVDLAAVDRAWCGTPMQRDAAADVAAAAAGDVAPAGGVEPEPTADPPDAAALAVAAVPDAVVLPMPRSADRKAPTVRARSDRSAEPAAQPGRDAGATPAWTTTRLDQGPGWSLDVVRPRSGGEAG
jgi:hypothetical protein